MFQLISVLSFLSIILTLVFVNKNSKLKSGNSILAEVKGIRFKDFSQHPQKNLYILCIASFIVLTFTGFLPILFTGNSMTGVLLLLHVLASPVFAICITIVCVLWAHDHRFRKEDWQTLKLVAQRKKDSKFFKQIDNVGQKTTFWLVVILSFSVILSILLGMYPIWGTNGQEVLLHLHGYSALFLVLAAAAKFYYYLNQKK